MNPQPCATRFAPSPTGRLHLGNLRTALFSYLLARKQGGRFLLRVEDSDLERSRDEYIDAQVETLRWLGLTWEPDKPLRQSQRTSVYAAYYDRLIETYAAYHCFCSAEELAAQRRAQLRAGKPPRYPGTCADLTETERKRRRENGEPASLRLRVPADDLGFVDLIRGPQNFSGKDLGDFVIRRSDGSPAFLFCNAADDADMGITHVLRGEDHLSNTPRQILVLQALGLTPPAYGHLPLLHGANDKPMSKRAGSQELHSLREQGYLPLALTNYLARIGHSYPDGELRSLTGLAQDFELEHVGRASARFDPEQLLHWQAEAVNVLNDEQLSDWLRPSLESLVPAERMQAFLTAVSANIRLPADAEDWAEIVFVRPEPLAPEDQSVMREAGQGFFVTAAALLREGVQPQNFPERLAEATGRKGRELYLPLRLALTGRPHGPELPNLLAVLSADVGAERLEAAAAQAASN